MSNEKSGVKVLMEWKKMMVQGFFNFICDDTMQSADWPS